MIHVPKNIFIKSKSIEKYVIKGKYTNLIDKKLHQYKINKDDCRQLQLICALLP